jgi:uncharacterized protein with GYD domain
VSDDEYPIEYVLLVRLTEDGAKSCVGGMHRLVTAMQKAMESLRGTIRIVMTLGRYDLVATGTVMNDESLAWFTAHLADEGDVRVETLRAFTPAEWDQIQGVDDPDGVDQRPFGH